MRSIDDIVKTLSGKERAFLSFLTEQCTTSTNLQNCELASKLQYARATINIVLSELIKFGCIKIETKIVSSDLMGWFDSYVRTITITDQGKEVLRRSLTRTDLNLEQVL